MCDPPGNAAVRQGTLACPLIGPPHLEAATCSPGTAGPWVGRARGTPLRSCGGVHSDRWCRARTRSGRGRFSRPVSSRISRRTQARAPSCGRGRPPGRTQSPCSGRWTRSTASLWKMIVEQRRTTRESSSIRPPLPGAILRCTHMGRGHQRTPPRFEASPIACGRSIRGQVRPCKPSRSRRRMLQRSSVSSSGVDVGPLLLQEAASR